MFVLLLFVCLLKLCLLCCFLDIDLLLRSRCFFVYCVYSVSDVLCDCVCIVEFVLRFCVMCVHHVLV